MSQTVETEIKTTVGQHPSLMEKVRSLLGPMRMGPMGELLFGGRSGLRTRRGRLRLAALQKLVIQIVLILLLLLRVGGDHDANEQPNGEKDEDEEEMGHGRSGGSGEGDAPLP